MVIKSFIGRRPVAVGATVWSSCCRVPGRAAKRRQSVSPVSSSEKKTRQLITEFQTHQLLMSNFKTCKNNNIEHINILYHTIKRTSLFCQSFKYFGVIPYFETHTHSHTYTYKHPPTHTYSHTHPYTPVHTHAHTHIVKHTHTQSPSVTHTCTQSHIHTQSHTYTHKVTHTHTVTLSHTHAQTDTHAHTHACYISHASLVTNYRVTHTCL